LFVVKIFIDPALATLFSFRCVAHFYILSLFSKSGYHISHTNRI